MNIKAYDKGYMAFRRGQDLHSNPYDFQDNAEAWDSWYTGWLTAQDDSESTEMDITKRYMLYLLLTAAWFVIVLVGYQFLEV